MSPLKVTWSSTAARTSGSTLIGGRVPTIGANSNLHGHSGGCNRFTPMSRRLIVFCPDPRNGCCPGLISIIRPVAFVLINALFLQSNTSSPRHSKPVFNHTIPAANQSFPTDLGKAKDEFRIPPPTVPLHMAVAPLMKVAVALAVARSHDDTDVIATVNVLSQSKNASSRQTANSTSIPNLI